MQAATLYSTWKQVATGMAPVYLIVIAVCICEGEVKKYTVLNLDGKLDATDIAEERFNELVEKKIFQTWKP